MELIFRRILAFVAIILGVLYLISFSIKPNSSTPVTSKSSELSVSQGRPTPSSGVFDDDLWTFDCEIPEQLPTRITLACADGGMFVDNIEWSAFNSVGATGKGIYIRNICEPDCATGKYEKTPVEISLYGKEKISGKYFLTQLTIKGLSGALIDQLNTSDTIEWDIGEYAKDSST
jgi:hypothetical protein